MTIEKTGRIVIFNDTKVNVESNDAIIKELHFGIDIDTGNLGFTTDRGDTWNWITVSGSGGSKYRQFLYTVISGYPTFLTDDNGNILTVALDME
jgi:hypothetical protein